MTVGGTPSEPGVVRREKASPRGPPGSLCRGLRDGEGLPQRAVGEMPYEH